MSDNITPSVASLYVVEHNEEAYLNSRDEQFKMDWCLCCTFGQAAVEVNQWTLVQRTKRDAKISHNAQISLFTCWQELMATKRKNNSGAGSRTPLAAVNIQDENAE